MTLSSRMRSLGLLTVAVLGAALVAYPAAADPSGRVARLSNIQGNVSYSPAGEDDWLDVSRNRPLIAGDRIWTERRARAEIQVGSSAIRIGPETSLEILALDDQLVQVEVTQGTVNLRVRRLYSGQEIEVATPTLAFAIDRPGRYRIDVDPNDNETTVVVWEGGGDAYGDGTQFPLQAGDTVKFYGTDLRDHELLGMPRSDSFDRYCLDRDQRLSRSGSLRYVSDDLVGYSDLDEYGTWQADRNYGNVWYPNNVGAGWAPYRDGYWTWQEPWGWTWVDDAPWGFAPSHYGRWAYTSNRWGWVPGPRNVRPMYAPALVAFVGGNGWSVSLNFGGRSPVGWFPLGPREVYVPSYPASRDYFSRVNVNNTVINNTTITNVYNNYSSGNINVNQPRYANRAVPGAMTAVPGDVFVNSRPVRPALIKIDNRAATTGQVTRVATVAPTKRSVLGPAAVTTVRPSPGALDRRVVARHAPAPEAAPFAAREQQLRQNPGQAPQTRAIAPKQGQAEREVQNVRVIAEPARAVNAREAGSRHGNSGRPEQPGQQGKRDAPVIERTQEPPQPQQPDAAPIAEQAKRADQAKRDAQAAERQSADQAKRAEQATREAQAAERQSAAQAQSAEQAKRADQAKRDTQAAERQSADQAKRAEQAKRDAQAAERQSAAQAQSAEQAKRADQAKRDAQAAERQSADQAKRAEQATREAQAAQQQSADQAKRAEQAKRDAQAAERQAADQAKRTQQAAAPQPAVAPPAAAPQAAPAAAPDTAATQQRGQGDQHKRKSPCEGLSPEDTAKCELEQAAKDKGPGPKP
ncbi:MAG: hypothetical protein IT483_12790 [Gammaproteobacteria bacterium]|nr:hypothetical protein [Gammaproteobacteria bacterium]